MSASRDDLDRALSVAYDEIDKLRAKLADAAQSLETISLQAGRDEFMKDMTDVRGYANSRARVAKGALSANIEPTKPEQLVWIGMEDFPEYEVGARYRIIIDDVQQECTELEKRGIKRRFRGDDSGTFPINEIQAWLPIEEPANKERAQ